VGDDQIVRAVISFVIVGLLVPAVLWYLGIRFGKPQLKVWGVVIGVTYLLVAGYSIAQESFDLFPGTYSTYLDGPGSRTNEAIVVNDATYHVNAAGSRNEIAFTPVAKYGEPATGMVTIAYEVQSPRGVVVAKAREKLSPGKGSNWALLKAEFIAPEEGVHKLILEIPRPVRKVRVEITERKK
jgi:hypothetical protein